jgi:hypothetical protein
MLGIVIGVAAVITLVALGRGAQKAVNERLQSLGTTLLSVRGGQVFRAGTWRQHGVGRGAQRWPQRLPRWSTQRSAAGR